MRTRKWQRYAIPFRDLITAYRPSLLLLEQYDITLDVLLYYILREWVELETSIWRYDDTRTCSPYEALLARVQMDFLELHREACAHDREDLRVVVNTLVQEILKRLFVFTEQFLENQIPLEIEGQAGIRFERIAGQQAIVDVYQ